MNAAATCLLALLLSGCVSTPVQPDPIAPTVVTKTKAVDTAAYAEREAPPELTEPLRVDMPEFVPLAQAIHGWDREGYHRYLRMLAVMKKHYRICSGFAGR